MGLASDPELKNALCEVRKAYRLIAVYQRRIVDMALYIQNSFGYNSWHFENINYDIRGRGLPTDRWSIDMLPLYDGLSLFYLPQKGESNYPKKNEWMLLVIFNNDTGFEPTNGTEPDPQRFVEVDKCESKLWLFAFGVKEDMENTNWQLGVQKQINWYEDIYTQIKGDEEKLIQTEKLWAAGKSYNLATIPDEQALERVVAEFRKIVDDKRKEIGVF